MLAQVIDPTYFQMITQLPPLAAEKDAVFVHDYFNSWTSTMFIGNELRLFAFEALFFCTIDMSLQNVSVCFIHPNSLSVSSQSYDFNYVL